MTSTALSARGLCAVASPRGPALSLRLNFVWTLGGNVIFAACQWGVLILLAKLGRPEDVGAYSLGLAITAPIMLFSGLQLRAVQATDARQEAPFADYAGTRVLTTAAGALLICGIGWFGYRGELGATIAAFGLSKGIESFSDVIYGLFQARERMDLVSRSLMLRGILSLASAGLCFMLWHAVWAAVCGTAAAWAAVFVGYDLRTAIRLQGGAFRSILPRRDRPAILHLLRLSFPLGIVTLLVSLNANIPRYLISSFRGVAELGIFSALGYFTLAGTTVVNAMGQSAMPRLAAYWTGSSLRDYRKLVSQLLGLGLVLGLLGIAAAVVAGWPVLKLLYGVAYARNTHLLVWLTVAGAVGYLTSFAGYSLTASRNFACQIPLYGACTVLILAACAWMVWTHGAIGAAQAMAAVGVVQLLATLVILKAAGRRRAPRTA